MKEKTLSDTDGWDPGLDWHAFLSEEFLASYFADLSRFVRRERGEGAVFPSPDQVFRAFRLTPLSQVKFVVLGQDPYHNEGQADGLSFSVPSHSSPPPSLRNIFRELVDDIGCQAPKTGNLESWARQGGLLLNTVLTVRAHQPHSHRDQGWEKFTDAVISCVNHHCDHVVFLLWGQAAQKKQALLNSARHSIIKSPHPSPLSAHRGFLGSRPFSKVNRALAEFDKSPVDWGAMNEN